MKKIFSNHYKEFDTKLFLILIFGSLFPTIYKTFRIHLLGNLPSSDNINIAGQIAWLNILYEILNESFLLSIYFLIGKSIKAKFDLENKIKTGLISGLLIYFFLSTTLFFFANEIVTFMKQDKTLILETTTYIKTESVANIFVFVSQFFFMILILLESKKNVFYFLFLQLISTVFSDVFLLSDLSYSFKFGVLGIAYSNIISNIILIIFSIYIIKKSKINISKFRNLKFSWLKEWKSIGLFLGIESLIRNSIFILIILRLINQIGEPGNFWITNSFIWGWLLLPILQLGIIIKRDFGISQTKQFDQKISFYLFLTTKIILIWIITIPFWKYFLANILNVSNTEYIFKIILLSIPFYIIFAFNNVFDSFFIGIGKTKYLLYQSIITNIIYYGLIYFLVFYATFELNLIILNLIFLIGNLIDSISTFIMYYLYKNKLTK